MQCLSRASAIIVRNLQEHKTKEIASHRAYCLVRSLQQHKGASVIIDRCVTCVMTPDVPQHPNTQYNGYGNIAVVRSRQ